MLYSYVFLRMDESIESLDKAKMFSELYANFGNWQIEMGDKDAGKTTLMIHHGLLKYAQMAFRLNSALATIQRVIDFILAFVKWQEATMYIEIIINILKSPEQRFWRINEVLCLL